MTLQPVAETPGVWRAGEANIAGVHALIIGISDYPYLAGGSAPNSQRAPDNGGLGQLEVSALSAAKFFEWMLGAGPIGGAPLASCRLHLAPRANELADVQLLTQGHYAPADYKRLRDTLDDWSSEMSVGGRSSLNPNVALFFYSGHGVEVQGSQAILASDILTQLAADRGVNKAIAVDPMMAAVKSYEIDRGLFFIDACRDAPMAARLINLVGDQPLKLSPAVLRRPDAVIALKSTASGLKAYQPQDKETLFTQAVLDGLNGPPPQFIPYDTTNLPWALKFAALEGHVKRMVPALLAAYSPLAIQAVEPWGMPYNGETIVARKEGPPLDAGDEPITAQPVLDLPQMVQASAVRTLSQAKSLDGAVIGALRAGNPYWRGDLFDYGIMHEVLGHETATVPWTTTLQFLDARTGETADARTTRIYAAHSQEIGDRIVAWVDIAVEPEEGEALWIGAGATDMSPGSAVVLPRDLKYATPVRLDVQLDREGGQWRVTQMSARLADPSPADAYMAGNWDILFEAQKTEAFADLASAASPVEADFERLQEILSAKRQSPLAATFATILLLRAGALDHLLDWPRNLANWFEWLADGPVLWAETLLRRSVADAVDLAQPDMREALGYFSMLADRGVPMLSHSLTLAIRQAEVWRAFVDSERLDWNEQSNLRAALENVDRAGRYALSGMGFSRFVNVAADFSPEHVLGARKPRAQRQAATA
ncbi:caspase family protein [Sphingomonas sp. CARO-RG-8B-R24-01]|uniref:caspase family protein n=1 Tax=Sphingomonas sp. CARO-RG-8B-R24-01 TaxID=2914831 RepID=UPI001F570FB9|nr:caspase family protein [Sphingomonas sp. CARO-RG-8B-R24-01]